MFRQITARGAALATKNFKVFSFLPTRSFANDDDDNCVLPGNGLKTLCGNLKEEAHLKKNDDQWIKKLRAEGTTVKSIGYFDAWDAEGDEEAGIEAPESCMDSKDKNDQWIKKLRAEGTTVKSIGYFDAWHAEGDEEAGTEAPQVQESCMDSKNKNGFKESYVLEQQKEALTKKFESACTNTEATAEGAKTDSAHDAAAVKEIVNEDDRKKC